MSELSERIRRNMTPNLDGWVQRLMKEAADEIERLNLIVADFDKAYVAEATECARLRAELKAQKEAAQIVAAKQQ